jgi:hypothetical protein
MFTCYFRLLITHFIFHDFIRGYGFHQYGRLKKISCITSSLPRVSVFEGRSHYFPFSLAFMRTDNDSLDNLCYEIKGCAKRRGLGYELFSIFHKDDALGNLAAH